MAVTWKRIEMEVARLFGTERTGPAGRHGPDAQTKRVGVEVKHRGNMPKWFKHGTDVLVLPLTVGDKEYVVLDATFLSWMMRKAGIITKPATGKLQPQCPRSMKVTGASHSKWPKWMAKAIKQAKSGGDEYWVVVFHQKGSQSYPALVPIDQFDQMQNLGGLNDGHGPHAGRTRRTTGNDNRTSDRTS